MKKLSTLFLALFLFSTQANAFIGVWVAKKAYSQLPEKEKKQAKKVLFEILKPNPKAKKSK